MIQTIKNNEPHIGTKTVRLDDYKRKYYDVEVSLDVTANCTKRVYIDEIDAYRNDMSEMHMKAIGLDLAYIHKDEFNYQNQRMAEELAKEDVESDDYIDEIEVHNMNVLVDPQTGEETEEGEIWQCVICNDYFTGWGNNPDPVKNYGDCCNACNTNVVIPERLRSIINHNHLGVA